MDQGELWNHYNILSDPMQPTNAPFRYTRLGLFDYTNENILFLLSPTHDHRDRLAGYFLARQSFPYCKDRVLPRLQDSPIHQI